MDFAGGFDCKIAASDPTTAKSHSGQAITYAGCPVTWSSKMQTLTALSMTKAEYITLLTALCDLIPTMEPSKEMNQQNIITQEMHPKKDTVQGFQRQ